MSREPDHYAESLQGRPAGGVLVEEIYWIDPLEVSRRQVDLALGAWGDGIWPPWIVRHYLWGCVDDHVRKVKRHFEEPSAEELLGMGKD